MGDTCPYGFNHTGRLHTEGLGQGQRVESRALIDVYIIEPTSFMSDAHLPITGFSGWHVHYFELIRPPEFFDHNSLIHHALLCLKMSVAHCRAGTIGNSTAMRSTALVTFGLWP